MIALASLGVIIATFLAWCVYDFAASMGWVRGQHSASKYIKAWVRENPWHKVGLAIVIVTAGAYGSAYLLLHLIAQVV